ncbi:OTU domain-containing protein [Abeliophyllum distichum]|uniref:Ubiquitin thioesterase OTU n=1 Tax=Abeliophyllum distichum TaxID=126358 RepID=A0ABD1VT89_9LAMI
MLGVLCGSRTRPWMLTPLSLSYAHSSPASYSDRRRAIVAGRGESVDYAGKCSGGDTSIWKVILPVGRRTAVFGWHEHEVAKMAGGEGSWNVAWDARPARWLHHPDSAWLLYGVFACLALPLLDYSDLNSEVSTSDVDKADGFSTNVVGSDASDCSSPNYRVTVVPADGRCLFRAIAHIACLRNGDKAPDENRQRELADELRAQVVEELLKRKKEVEWFIEEDFDAYVKRIQQPYVWGGEPELLMASHVLRTPISVFMIERSSGSLMKIANYGEGYHKDEENPINVLFHGYGHYDILETIPDPSCQKINM